MLEYLSSYLLSQTFTFIVAVYTFLFYLTKQSFQYFDAGCIIRRWNYEILILSCWASNVKKSYDLIIDWLTVLCNKEKRHSIIQPHALLHFFTLFDWKSGMTVITDTYWRIKNKWAERRCRFVKEKILFWTERIL